MPKNKFKCPKCDWSFSMAAHLARHTSTMHGTKRKKAATKTKGKKKRGRKKRRAVGRPKGVGRRFGLSTMTLEQLGNLIAAAKTEARARIQAFGASL